MPWRECCKMDERLRFVAGSTSVALLLQNERCRFCDMALLELTLSGHGQRAAR
jgi:hypothetical protein